MIKAYKGFKKDMTCRGFQFEEGEEYVYDGEVKVCESGFHACERPLGCFDYYNPTESVYHEVELSDDISKSSDDTKVAAKKIKIGARLDIAGLVNAQFEYVKEHTTSDCADPKAASAGYKGAANAGDYGAASAGDCGAACAGYKGAASAGDYGAASAGDCGAACAGYQGAACAGYQGAVCAGDGGAAGAGDRGAARAGYQGAACAGDGGAASAGDYGAASAGVCGTARAGDYGAASAGDYGAAISRGSASIGCGGVAIARGDESNKNKVRGGIGAILVIVLERETSSDINAWKAVIVDGENIKADTWYCLKDGKFVEISD